MKTLLIVELEWLCSPLSVAFQVMKSVLLLQPIAFEEMMIALVVVVMKRRMHNQMLLDLESEPLFVVW